MNLLADESVDRPIVERLRADGHMVEYVVELAPGISDDEVLQRANGLQAQLITEDKDFGELVYRLKRVHCGVILLRLYGISGTLKADFVAQALIGREVELHKAFTVVSPASVRIRH